MSLMKLQKCDMTLPFCIIFKLPLGTREHEPVSEVHSKILGIAELKERKEECVEIGEYYHHP